VEGNLDSALTLHEEGVQIWRDLEYPNELANSLLLQAQVFMKQEKWGPATVLVNEAERIATLHGLAGILPKIQLISFFIHSKSG
jgi:hypothetical protein